MPADAGLKFLRDFAKRIDGGDVDESLLRELRELTTNQRAQLAQMLIERQAQRMAEN
jgi:hypothetical protein